jgi:hypothetical protein
LNAARSFAVLSVVADKKYGKSVSGRPLGIAEDIYAFSRDASSVLTKEFFSLVKDAPPSVARPRVGDGTRLLDERVKELACLGIA